MLNIEGGEHRAYGHAHGDLRARHNHAHYAQQAQAHYNQQQYNPYARYNHRQEQQQPQHQYTQQPRQLHQPQYNDQSELQRHYQLRMNQQRQQQLMRAYLQQQRQQQRQQLMTHANLSHGGRSGRSRQTMGMQPLQGMSTTAMPSNVHSNLNVAYSRTHANPNAQPHPPQQLINTASSTPRSSVSVSNVSAPDRYGAVKHIGQGTFADIWEVYALNSDGAPDENEPKHFALKALRKGKCVGADGKLDVSRYRRYSCAIVSEGKRIAMLNALDPACRAQLVRSREILRPGDVSLNLAAAVAGDVRTNPIGPCVVLELLGVSLIHFEILRKRQMVAIPLATVRYIALQLLNAMSFLHGVGGYIHADLKPENVVLTIEHSVNGNLMSNAYPNVKVVDLGNAISIGRTVSSFEIQSLHYRAPELVFGNEVTAAIDLWSVGCILLQLAFSFGSYSKNSSQPQPQRHYAVFASRNNAQLASRIASILSSFPAYFYNDVASFHWTPISTAATNALSARAAAKGVELPLTHCDADYARQQSTRRERLFKRINADPATADAELTDFLDLMGRLLDPNPATRLTSEDATQHRFCIGEDYVRHDTKIFELLRNKFDSAFPRVTISSDADRQRRLDAQLQRYREQCAAVANGGEVPRPSGKATARRTSHNDEECTDTSVRHSRAICLVHGCCDVVTLPPTSMLPSQNSNGRAAIDDQRPGGS